MEKSAIAKFLTECGDLKDFVGKMNQKVELLELEVGALLRRQDVEGDGPSDASLQVLQEARSIKKSTDTSIRESSELAKNMDGLLKDLLEKIKQSYKQTEAMETRMADYGYDIPEPLDPAIFDIFRDSKGGVAKNQKQLEELTATVEAGKNLNDVTPDHENGDDITSENENTVSSEQEESQASGINSSTATQDSDKVESDNEILDKTDSDAQDDIEETETKLKHNSKGKPLKHDRYEFQTSIISTPVQNIEFSKKAINFQNSYLFQSPMSERDQTSSAANFGVIPQSPPKSVYSILKPQSSFSNLHSPMSSQTTTSIYNSAKKPGSSKPISAHVTGLLNSAKKPSRATISVLKPTLENEETKTVTSVLSSLSGFSNTIAPTDNGSTPTKSSTTVEECETPEHVREFLKDFKLKVNKDKENVEKKANQEADKLDTLPGFPSKQRESILPPSVRESIINKSSKPKVRESIAPSDLMAIIADRNRRIENQESPPVSAAPAAAGPETPQNVREFLRSLGR